MTLYNPMRELPARAGYGKGDFLVLCGELFGRGYANGIVEEAKSRGMTVIGTTVGRRDADGTLRALTAEEITAAAEILGGTIINVPLEAGFDLEPADDGPAGQFLAEGPGDVGHFLEVADSLIEPFEHLAAAVVVRGHQAGRLGERPEPPFR